MRDPRVEAIRAHPKVGAGSLTGIDEAWTDAELLEALDTAGIADPAGAVAWAVRVEGLHLEQALNARWGEDDDPQLKAWEEWNKS